MRFALARNAGFRVTTNSTLFADAEPERCRQFFDESDANLVLRG